MNAITSNSSQSLAGLCILILAFSPQLFATTVVVIRTPQRVIIAADSLAAANDKHFQTCKIGTNKQFPISFAIAGSVQDNGGFSAIDLAETAISTSPDVQSAAHKFELSTTLPFENFVRRRRRDDPAAFKKLLTEPEPLQVAFAAVEKNVPIYVIAYFTVTVRGQAISVAAHENRCPGNGCPSGRGADILGENGAARIQVKNPAFWSGLDPLSAARKLAEIEIAEYPEIVGPPISILTIDATGTHWNDRGECK